MRRRSGKAGAETSGDDGPRRAERSNAPRSGRPVLPQHAQQLGQLRAAPWLLPRQLQSRTLSLRCGSLHRIGIDRIDSSKAYTSSNCVSCCKSCNFMKNTMRYDDFISQALLVAQVHSAGSMRHCTEQRQHSSPRHLHGYLLPPYLHTPQVHVHHHYHVHHCEHDETTCEKNMPTEAAATGVFL